MLLLSGVPLAATMAVVLASYCCSIFRDVRDAQDELRHQIQQFYHAALRAKGLEHDETVPIFIVPASRCGRILEENRGLIPKPARLGFWSGPGLRLTGISRGR